MKAAGVLALMAFGYFVIEVAYSDQTLYWASLILVGIAVFIVANGIFTEEEQFKASEKLEDAEDVKESKSLGPILKFSRPFFKRYVSPIVASMKNKNKIKEKYKRNLATAGLTNDLSTFDFYAFKLFLIIGFPILFVGARGIMGENWPLIYVIPIGVLGFFYPNIWLNGRMEKRQKEVMLNMPFVVDMLALSVEAGLDFVAAMSKVIEKAPDSALTEELEILIKEIKIGSSRAEALRQFSWRIDLLPIASFTATLIAADSVGASIGPILKSLSSDMRQKRSADAEQAGAKAATKILFPMMGFIIPSVIIIVFAPVAMDAMGLTGK